MEPAVVLADPHRALVRHEGELGRQLRQTQLRTTERRLTNRLFAPMAVQYVDWMSIDRVLFIGVKYLSFAKSLHERGHAAESELPNELIARVFVELRFVEYFAQPLDIYFDQLLRIQNLLIAPVPLPVANFLDGTGRIVGQLHLQFIEHVKVWSDGVLSFGSERVPQQFGSLSHVGVELFDCFDFRDRFVEQLLALRGNAQF